MDLGQMCTVRAKWAHECRRFEIGTQRVAPYLAVDADLGIEKGDFVSAHSIKLKCMILALLPHGGYQVSCIVGIRTREDDIQGIKSDDQLIQIAAKLTISRGKFGNLFNGYYDSDTSNQS